MLAKTTKTEREIATMKTKLTNMIRQIAITLVALVATTSFVAAQDRASANPNPPDPPASIVGVWQVVRHGVDCNTGQDLFYYSTFEIFNADGTMSADGGAYQNSTNEYG